MIELLPLTLGDAGRAASLIRRAFAEQGLETIPPTSALKESREVVALKLTEGGGFGASDHGDLVGLVLYALDGDALYLGQLAVLPSRRGRGLAARLIERAEVEAGQRGYAKMRLRARLELPLNRRLFARLGYVEVGFGSHAGLERPTFVILEKTLGEANRV